MCSLFLVSRASARDVPICFGLPGVHGGEMEWWMKEIIFTTRKNVCLFGHLGSRDKIISKVQNVCERERACKVCMSIYSTFHLVCFRNPRIFYILSHLCQSITIKSNEHHFDINLFASNTDSIAGMTPFFRQEANFQLTRRNRNRYKLLHQTE